MPDIHVGNPFDHAPKVGDTVHYYNESKSPSGPYAALVVMVHPESPTDAVNLAYFDQAGVPNSFSSVPRKDKCPAGFSCWYEAR